MTTPADLVRASVRTTFVKYAFLYMMAMSTICIPAACALNITGNPGAAILLTIDVLFSLVLIIICVGLCNP